MKKTAGFPSNSHEARTARGAPSRTFTVREPIDDAIERLAAHLGTTRSQVLDRAVRLLAEKENIRIVDKG